MTRRTKNTQDGLGIEAITHYRNLQYHRSVILEGIRIIALRNLNHLDRTMTALGVNTLADDRDIEAVNDWMFKDQGMDPDLNSRSILEFATFIPWEMYLCLLSVELESYRTESKKDPRLVFSPLEELFQSNEATIQHLNALRDKILHPGKPLPLDHALDNFVETAGEVDGHYYSTVFRAQALIDAYASWLRQSLFETVGEELFHAAKPLGPRDNDRLTKLQKARQVLSLPLPKLGDEPRDEAVQTPFDLRTWYMLWSRSLQTQGQGDAQAYPAFVQKAKTDCARMLMRSLVLSNEYVNLFDIGKLRAIKSRTELDAHNPFDLLVTGTPTLTKQQAQNLIAPARVSTALLAEPLRIYYQAVKRVPELRHTAIEEIAGPGPVPPMLRHLRNIVFHVASDNIDPDDTESKFLSQLGGHLHATMSLLPPLIEFYMSVR